jgi:hypothetical protein
LPRGSTAAKGEERGVGVARIRYPDIFSVVPGRSWRRGEIAEIGTPTNIFRYSESEVRGVGIAPTPVLRPREGEEWRG